MRILLILLLLTTTVYAASDNNWTIIGPSKDPNKTSQYNFDNSLYTHFNQLQTVTVDPNGDRTGDIGDLVLYNNGGTYTTMVQTTSPSGTTWQSVSSGGSGSGTVGIGTTGILAVYTGTTTVGPLGTPTACSAGSYAAGIDSSGNSTGCSAAGTGTVNSGVASFYGRYPSTGTTIDDSAVTMDNGINVGIGTTNPLAKLTVNGNVGIGTTQNFLSKTPPNGGMIIEESIGIGTWNPDAKISTSMNGTIAAGIISARSDTSSSSFIANGVNAGNCLGTLCSVSSLTALNVGTTISTILNSVERHQVNVVSQKYLILANYINHRFFRIQAPEINSLVGGFQITNPSTLYIEGEPTIAGATTFVNPTALNVASGKVVFGGNVGIGTINPFGGKLIIASGNVGIGSLAPGTELDITGNIRMNGTGAGLFRIQSSANQACTTTCTTGKAIVGLDKGTLGVVLPSFVGPADATADDCLCGS